MKQVQNIKDVRDVLAEVAAEAWKNPDILPQSELMVKAMGKINQSVALELNHAALAKVKPNIPFLNYEKEVADEPQTEEAPAAEAEGEL
jgi:hypothetical protein